MNLRNIFQNADGVQEFQAGATIFARGTPGDVMYVVLDGELEIRTGSGFVDAIGSGDIVGEMALIDSEARSATVVAKSDCRLVPVDKKRFLFMVQETPFFALHVMRVLADRLRKRPVC
jgi:CRP/FNR family transcriptional regulator, cyclic AMP receptor protein